MPEVVRRWGPAVVTVVLAAVVLVGLLTADPSEPDRARSLAARLRCPVCQGESVADSPSETARAMNSLIEDQVDAGRSDAEILAFFRQRYGDWILLDPPAEGRTLVVWALPALGLVVGVAAIALAVRRGPAPELDDEQRARVTAARQGR
jgi:cytochrome c-type biogenesis protein CcmH